MSSSSAGGLRTLTAATSRWSLAPTWRSAILSSQTSACPPASPAVEVAKGGRDGMTREQLLDQIQLERMKAEERIRRLKAEAEEASATGKDDSSSEEDDDEKEEAAVDRGDEKHDAPVKPPGVESEDDDGDDESEEDAGEYENELEYFVHEILCLDAINHESPTGQAEVQCTYCEDGRKFASEFACSSCAFVRGVCASCRKVVVLKSLADPAKGAAVCLALLTDEPLLKRTMEIDDTDDDGKEEIEAIREQIVFMLDAYFDKQ